ncbi:4-hydroxy-4-methyl-2-oxoglutarate aldolase [Catenulispora sp. EB89]|uniref:RraA family protein n=1 Tax=Catenulispora sp. EB89 TaxID=3156257 RepID=UPI0035148A92
MDTFADVPTTTLADVLSREHVMDLGIRSLTGTSGRLAGPAFTVRCPPGDNLMVHAAIYRAAPGSVIVVDTGGDVEYAVAGGNVMAVAQRHGVAGLVVDGVIRDVGEAREAAFPVFGRGVVPIPGTKAVVGEHNVAVRCGGVTVGAGDIVVADEDGVVVVPAGRRDEAFAAARAKLAKDEAETLDEWERAHRARIDAILADGGFGG